MMHKAAIILRFLSCISWSGRSVNFSMRQWYGWNGSNRSRAINQPPDIDGTWPKPEAGSDPVLQKTPQHPKSFMQMNNWSSIEKKTPRPSESILGLAAFDTDTTYWATATNESVANTRNQVIAVHEIFAFTALQQCKSKFEILCNDVRLRHHQKSTWFPNKPLLWYQHVLHWTIVWRMASGLTSCHPAHDLVAR